MKEDRARAITSDAGGYAWVTRRVPPTASSFSLDHVFLRGLTLMRPNA